MLKNIWKRDEVDYNFVASTMTNNQATIINNL